MNYYRQYKANKSLGVVVKSLNYRQKNRNSFKLIWKKIGVWMSSRELIPIGFPAHADVLPDWLRWDVQEGRLPWKGKHKANGHTEKTETNQLKMKN